MKKYIPHFSHLGLVQYVLVWRIKPIKTLIFSVYIFTPKRGILCLCYHEMLLIQLSLQYRHTYVGPYVIGKGRNTEKVSKYTTNWKSSEVFKRFDFSYSQLLGLMHNCEPLIQKDMVSGYSGDELMVGLNDLSVFNNSMIIWFFSHWADCPWFPLFSTRQQKKN